MTGTFKRKYTFSQREQSTERDMVSLNIRLLEVIFSLYFLVPLWLRQAFLLLLQQNLSAER